LTIVLSPNRLEALTPLYDQQMSKLTAGVGAQYAALLAEHGNAGEGMAALSHETLFTRQV
jgi:hypothetical protein